ncbi:MAG: riboflavin biosynthesis protein RibF [Myxococcales bacterium]|nr:riboflavin biosynthesis protein RibF [Myxococcales bacterium]
MKVLRQLVALPPDTAACVGAFDGLHRGHIALLEVAAQLAPAVALVTFDPHPAQILAPERAPPLLQSASQRERVCRELGVDVLVLLPFDRELASTEPAAFVARVLLSGLAPAAVVVGPDFRFGAGRRGGVAELQAILQGAEVPLAIAPEIACPDDPQVKLSSTRIRGAVAAGALASVTDMLGRHYAVEGVVVRGAARGRTLGFRTANVDCQGALLPPRGVYAAVLSELEGGRARRRWPAVANLGVNPTFQDGREEAILEVHALDAELGEALYDRPVEVAFVERLRPEQRFPDPEALRQQIARDAASARELLTADALARVSATPLTRPQARRTGAT